MAHRFDFFLCLLLFLFSLEVLPCFHFLLCRRSFLLLSSSLLSPVLAELLPPEGGAWDCLVLESSSDLQAHRQKHSAATPSPFPRVTPTHCSAHSVAEASGEEPHTALHPMTAILSRSLRRLQGQGDRGTDRQTDMYMYASYYYEPSTHFS